MATAEAEMIRRDVFSEYVSGSMWVMPVLSAVAALALGASLSVIDLGAGSPLGFQGYGRRRANPAHRHHRDDGDGNRAAAGTRSGRPPVVLDSVPAASAAQFLGDRPNQIVLSTFVATFAYSAAGLYTVGVSGGNRSAGFPRLAVSGALVLLFASLGLLVYFAHHLTHSIQIDEIMRVVGAVPESRPWRRRCFACWPTARPTCATNPSDGRRSRSRLA
jgi:uncharacterized membrane protein